MLGCRLASHKHVLKIRHMYSVLWKASPVPFVMIMHKHCRRVGRRRVSPIRRRKSRRTAVTTICKHVQIVMHKHSQSLSRRHVSAIRFAFLNPNYRTSMLEGRRLPCVRPTRCRYPSPSAPHAACLPPAACESEGWVRAVRRASARA